MFQNKLKDDIPCGVGNTSWYIQKPLQRCKGLFENITNEFIAHAFSCKCGNCQIYINREKNMQHNCDKCGCSYFYEPEYFISTTNTILVNILLNPVLETTKEGYKATLYLDIPFDININSTKLLYKKKKIATIKMDYQGNKSFLSKYKLTSYAEEKINTVFVEYIYRQIRVRLLNSDILHFMQISTEEKYEVVSFFIKYSTIIEAEFYFWERKLCKELVDFYIEKNTPIESLKYIAFHKEKSVLRALFLRYDYEINKGKFDPLFPFMVCRVFDDVNIITALLKDFSLSLDTDYSSVQIYEINKLFLFFEFLKNYYNKFEIADFIRDMTSNMLLFEDIYNMFDNTNRVVYRYFTRVKISLVNIHDEFVKIHHLNHVSSSYTFSYEKNDLQACIQIDSLEYRLPRSGKELSEWSIQLKNCLFSYADKIYMKQSIVYGVFKNNEINYAIEISNGRIIQALGYLNKKINQVDKSYIDEWFEKHIY